MSDEQRDPRLVLQDAVMDVRVRAQWKTAVLALLRFAGRDMVCWTSVPRLAEMAGVTGDTMRTMLQALQDAGGISREARATDNGAQTTWRWTVHPDRIVAAMVQCDGARARRAPPLRQTGGHPTTGERVPSDRPEAPPTMDGRGTLRHTGGGPSDTSDHPPPTDRRRPGEMTRGVDPESRPGESEPVNTRARARAHELVLVEPAEAEVVTLTPRPTRKVKDITPLSTVWTLYRRWHPQAGNRPPKSWGIHHAIDEHGEDAVCALVEWAHESDHQRAQYLRDNDYLGATLFRPSKLPEYIAWATEWVASGRASQMSAAERKKRDPHGIYQAMADMKAKNGSDDSGFPF